MTEKEKQIKELTQEIEFAKKGLWNAENLKKEDYSWHSRGIAVHLLHIGYTKNKIPEGSVVLDRHEHQHYCAYKIIEPQIRGCLDRERELERKLKELEEQRDRQAYIAEELIQEKHRWTEQARKETAKEILSLAIKHDNGYETDMTRFISDLKKQYGVVEE